MGQKKTLIKLIREEGDKYWYLAVKKDRKHPSIHFVILICFLFLQPSLICSQYKMFIAASYPDFIVFKLCIRIKNAQNCSSGYIYNKEDLFF